MVDNLRRGNRTQARLENFWGLLKRSINETYVYEGERSAAAISGIVGRRVAFDELIGKNQSGVELGSTSGMSA